MRRWKPRPPELDEDEWCIRETRADLHVLVRNRRAADPLAFEGRDIDFQVGSMLARSHRIDAGKVAANDRRMWRALTLLHGSAS